MAYWGSTVLLFPFPFPQVRGSSCPMLGGVGAPVDVVLRLVGSFSPSAGGRTTPLGEDTPSSLGSKLPVPQVASVVITTSREGTTSLDEELSGDIVMPKD